MTEEHQAEAPRELPQRFQTPDAELQQKQTELREGINRLRGLEREVDDLSLKFHLLNQWLLEHFPNDCGLEHDGES